MPSFNHFEQNTHTCPLIYYPSDRILNRTREPSLWKGGERRDKNTLSPPPSSRRSGRHRCYLRCAAQPLNLPTAPSARLHGRRLGTKMVVFQQRRHLPHTPPPTGSDGSLSPKMPDSVPPPRKRHHPSRIPRLLVAGAGAGEGWRRERKEYGSGRDRRKKMPGGRRILHYTVLFSAIFPSP